MEKDQFTRRLERDKEGVRINFDRKCNYVIFNAVIVSFIQFSLCSMWSSLTMLLVQVIKLGEFHGIPTMLQKFTVRVAVFMKHFQV